MLFWTKLFHTVEVIGYARAASQLASQGHYELAKQLMIDKARIQSKREKAIQRLERIKKAKASYEPGDHYMKGHKVAFWKGKAHA